MGISVRAEGTGSPSHNAHLNHSPLDMLLSTQVIGKSSWGGRQNNDQDVVKLKGTLLITSWYFVWFWTIVSGA